MAVSTRITFRHMDALAGLDRVLKRRVERLAHVCSELSEARVVIEAARPGLGYRVGLELHLPGGPISVGHEPRVELSDALAQAFRAARRALVDRAGRRQTAAGRVI